MEPASIRYRNPGAMWGSALAIKWGAEKKAVTLNDGKGQGNNIAVFPTYVQGICAQLDLWRTSARYKDKTFAEAIKVWSGGNNVESYIAFVLKRVPGMTRNTVMNDAFWRSPMGIQFLKAQAWHEAGKEYPVPDADWIEAQRRVMGGVPVIAATTTPSKAPGAPVTPADHAKVGGAVIVATGTAGAAAAANAGMSALQILGWIGGLSAVAVGSFIIGYRIIKGHWPWTSISTGNQSPALSLPSHQPSAASLALASAQLELSSAASLATPSQPPSTPTRRRKQSAKPLPKTRTRRASSATSKKRAVKKSSPKRKLKSKS